MSEMYIQEDLIKMKKQLEKFKNMNVDALEGLRPDKYGAGLNNELIHSTIDSCIKIINVNYELVLNSQELKDYKKENNWINKIKNLFKR